MAQLQVEVKNNRESTSSTILQLAGLSANSTPLSDRSETDPEQLRRHYTLQVDSVSLDTNREDERNSVVAPFRVDSQLMLLRNRSWRIQIMLAADDPIHVQLQTLAQVNALEPLFSISSLFGTTDGSEVVAGQRLQARKPPKITMEVSNFQLSVPLVHTASFSLSLSFTLPCSCSLSRSHCLALALTLTPTLSLSLLLSLTLTQSSSWKSFVIASYGQETAADRDRTDRLVCGS